MYENRLGNNNWRVSDLEPLITAIKKEYNNKLTGVEIGCLAGESTEVWLKSDIFTKLYCVDPWKNGYDNNDGNNQTTEDCEQIFDYLAQQHPNNIIKLKMTSIEAAKVIDDYTIDFVYIDGLHTYEGVKNDILTWAKKIKPGGIISGHDYGNGCFPGVHTAVDELIKIDFLVNYSWAKFNFNIKDTNIHYE